MAASLIISELSIIMDWGHIRPNDKLRISSAVAAIRSRGLSQSDYPDVGTRDPSVHTGSLR